MFSSAFQHYLFAGVITSSELNQLPIQLIIDSILKHGFYPNKQINKEQWLKFSNLPQPHPLPSLSKKEAEVLHLVCNGFSGIQIRELESIGKTRYGTIVRNIKLKLKCESLTELIQVSLINKWVIITPDSYVRKHPYISST